MRKIWKKIKKPLCVIIVFACLLLLLGCAGNLDLGGDIDSYCFQGAILLGIAIAVGIIGGVFE